MADYKGSVLLDDESRAEETPAMADQPAKALSVKRAGENDMHNATYSFTGEDHTLGNLLRNQIIKNAHVEFCAYSVPHPSEPVMNVRIQCHKDGSNNDTKKVLNHGLKRISKICDVLTEKFQKNLAEFKDQDDGDSDL